MPPRSTRSKGKAASQTTPKEDTTSATNPHTLHPTEPNPPHLLVLPRSASSQARIVSLSNPATGRLNRYLFCPTTGLYEFIHVSVPKSEPRSWLLQATTQRDETCKRNEGELSDKIAEEQDDVDSGYVLDSAGLLVATPFDPLFLLTPLFPSASEEPQTGLARTVEDHFEILGASSEHLKYLLRQDPFQEILLRRLETVSELTDAFGEEAYRPKADMLLKEIVSKARRMSEQGAWPQSLESSRIRQQLEPPATASLIRESSNASQDALMIDPNQPSNVSTTSSAHVTDQVLNLLRLRTALDYILVSYTSSGLRKCLQKMLAEKNLIDFKPLDDHLAHLAKMREEAQVLQSLSDNISRKRGAIDDEAAEIRAEKRRKKEEDDKKKKAESKALKDLKKVDTTGMKKLSSFFVKAPQKA